MFIFNLKPGDICYDIETYPNIFTFTAVHTLTDEVFYFEISPRKDDLFLLKEFLFACENNRLVGFNNLGFDYPVIHFIYHHKPSVYDIYQKAMHIIKSDSPFANQIWESDWIVPQIDLFKIHHFDNKAKSTSLKVLEFNMRMSSVEDLPFGVGLELTNEQMDKLAEYNLHDVRATIEFYKASKEQIKFREELSEKYQKNFLNHNDTKIGKDYFIMELEKNSPGCCFTYVNKRKTMRQTKRDKINLADVIIPYISFNHPEFNRILTWFKNQTITETNGVFKDINCSINGFRFDFGTGGIHGSLDSTRVEAGEECILDLDVASYYPNLAIVNKFYPAHLGEKFCTVYNDVFEQRRKYKKETHPVQNAMLKLALNGVYGDSNNQYSPFFDSQYTMSITINGQLLLCMLAEALLNSNEVKLIQINTDGLTIKFPHHLKDWVLSVRTWWEKLTGLELEIAEYKRMFIRDVNNYIAEGINGKIKRKGAYCHISPAHNPKSYELEWYKDHSALVVPKAAEAAMIHGIGVRDFILNHKDTYDFLLRTKVPRGSELHWGNDKVANIVRYYISSEGKPLKKVMPAAGEKGAYKRKNGVSEADYKRLYNGTWDERIHTKNKSVYEDREVGLHTGWNVNLCNNLNGHEFKINYEWYIKEAEKLVI